MFHIKETNLHLPCWVLDILIQYSIPLDPPRKTFKYLESGPALVTKMSTKPDQIMKEIPELQDIRHAAYWVSHRGWSEAGSGNFSIRLRDQPEDLRSIDAMAKRKMPLKAPELKGEYLLITTNGSRMRDMINELEGNVCLVRVLSNGEEYALLWGKERVTSEFTAHIAVQSMLKKERPEFRAVLHTQPTKLVALTHSPSFHSPEKLVDVLFRMHPENRAILPERIEVLPYAVPASLELGLATARALRSHRLVLWEKHGVVSIGGDLEEALDYVELMEKAAELYWTVASAGIEPTGLSDEQIAETLGAFGLM